MQVLAWLVRPCGFDACPSCVSSSLVHAAPWPAGPREAEGGAAGEAGLDLSKEHLRTQELESCAPVADTFGLSFLRGGVREEYAPLSRHHVGNRACVAARPERKRPPANPLTCYGGLAGGVSGSLTAMRGTVSSFPARTTVARHDRFCLQVLAWLVRPCGFDAARRVSLGVLWSTPPPGSQARVKPKA